MARSPRNEDASSWRRGAIGGLIAGIAMAMVAMLYTLAAQGDLLAPLKQMGATFFPADSGSAISMVAGLMLHMMMSIVLGVAFVLIARGRASGYGPLVAAGIGYIAIEWAIARFLVLPVVDRPLVTTFGASGGIVAHMMFGIVLGAWVAWRAAPQASPAGGLSGQRVA